MEQHQRAASVKYFRSPDALAERDGGDDNRGRCLPPVSGLGKQWVGLKGALDAARKDWMERVRYDHGEIFVDMSHAARVGSRCSRVSIGSFLGRVMYRCEVIAATVQGAVRATRGGTNGVAGCSTGCDCTASSASPAGRSSAQDREPAGGLEAAHAAAAPP